MTTDNVTLTLNGLTSVSHTCALNAVYSIECDISIQANSGVGVTITQSGSANSNMAVDLPVSAQATLPITTSFSCQPGDILSIAITSSTASDSQPNAVSTSLTITASA